MRKILTVFITFVFMFILVGCNQMTAEDSTQNDGLTSEQEILLELAKENEADVSKVLRRDSSKEFQSALAKTNGRVQEALIQYEGLNPEVLVDFNSYLAHAHFANPALGTKKERSFPQSVDEWDYVPFFSCLKKAGYEGRISLEAYTKDFDVEASRALELMRSLSK